MVSGELGMRVKDIMIGSIRGAGDLVGNAMQVARDLTGDALKRRNDPGQAAGVAEEVMNGALEAASEIQRDLADVVFGTLVGVLQGIGEVTALTPDLVTEATKAAITAVKAVGGNEAAAAEAAARGVVTQSPELPIGLHAAACGVARGVISGAVATGGDLEVMAARAMAGAVDGSAAIDADAVEVVRSIARGVVGGAAEAGENPGRVARQSVAAAITAAGSVDMDPERAVHAAAKGGMLGAQDVGEEAVTAVAGAVSGTIEGVEVSLEKSFAPRREPA